MKRVLILGVNGFIGHHLSRRLLESTDWEVYGMDMYADRLGTMVEHPRMHFFEGDITINREWIEYNIRKCGDHSWSPSPRLRRARALARLQVGGELVVRAAARYETPVFLHVGGVRHVPRRRVRLKLNLVYGPINKPRWIYACSKQLMDRVISAYGQEQGLNYTLFRPFNWIGSGLDSLFDTKEGSSRVVTQFLGQIVRGEPIHLVDGGHQKRSFADVSDGIDALQTIIANPGGIASGRIYNIGNPANHHSVRELAEMMLAMASDFPEYAESASRCRIVETPADDFYGRGYRTSAIACKIDATMAELQWRPKVDMATALRRIFESYRGHVIEARALLEAAA
jgi:nucleoside-diphosphate-sugar epimerase